MHSEEHELINADESARPEKNKFKAAHYSIAGAVTSFEWCDSDVGGNLNVGKLIGMKSSLRVGARRQTAKVGIDVRIVDVTRGNVVASFSTEGTAAATNLKTSGDIKGADFGTGAFFSSPLGKATRDAIDQAVDKIAAEVPADRQDPQRAASDSADEEDRPAARKTSRRAAQAAEPEEEPARPSTTRSSFACPHRHGYATYAMCKIIGKSETGKRFKVLYLNDGEEKLLNKDAVIAIARLTGKPNVAQKVLISLKSIYGSSSAKFLVECKVIDLAGEEAVVLCRDKELTLPRSKLYAASAAGGEAEED